PASIACAHSLGEHRSLYGTCEVPIHVITDWSISDHMNSSKQDVTS
ncbi:unnamed protein product, partial [Staurois parvus]